MKKQIVLNRITPDLAKVIWDIVKVKKKRKFIVNGGVMTSEQFDKAMAHL